MEKCFEVLTPSWFQRAYLYNGSIGLPFHDFRYRFRQDKDVIHAAAYSKVCYELAEDKTEADFPWDEAGVEQLKQWLQEQYERFLAGENK